MELKYDLVVGIDCRRLVFQSYLYGIEMREGYRGGQEGDKFQSYLYGIEIEHHRLVQVWSPEFQSYLYGIEILSESPLNEVVHVSIVPLWN